MDFDYLKKEVIAFYTENKLNTVQEIGLPGIFAPPIIGIAHAEDPLFIELKKPQVVGSHHLLPSGWLKNARTVISFFLPFTDRVRESNTQNSLPSREWLYGRIEGEKFNNALREFIADLICQNGGSAVVPVGDNKFQIKDLRSNWSERHVAFVAGLGTFGLNDSLITREGCAGRFGSVVSSIPMECSSRSYENLQQYCSMCLQCVQRCPAGAIQEDGKDAQVCSRYINEIKVRFSPRYGCGKCQTAVPCQGKIPV